MGSPTYDFNSRIVIEIIDRGARGQLARTGREARRTGSSFDYASRRGGFLNRTVATITKALTSMIGVLIAFNLLITGPQFAFNLLRQGIMFAVEAVATFEQRILSIQAILASVVRFDPDPVQNFTSAGLVAENVIGSLADRAAEMVGSLEEGALVFQTLLATGAQRYVTEVSELVDLTVLLANTIAGITVGQDRQRQLAEETRSLFTGQLRTTSLLARLLFTNRREMERFFEAAEESGDLVERLTDRLRGFVLASGEFATTFEGVRSSFLTIAQVISHRALGGAGGVLGELFNRLAGVAKEAQASTDQFNLLTASIAASGRIILNTLIDIFDLNLYLEDTDNLLDTLIKLVPLFTQVVVYLISTIKTLIDVSILFYQALDLVLLVVGALFRLFRDVGIFDVIITNFQRLVLVGSLLVDIFINIFRTFATFSESAAAVIADLRKIGIVFSTLNEELGTLASQEGFFDSPGVQEVENRLTALLSGFQNLTSGTSAFELAQAVGAIFGPERAAQLQRILDELDKLADATNNISVANTLDLSTLIEKNKELLRSTGLLRRQARNVRAVLNAVAEGFLPRTVLQAIAPATDVLASDIQQRIGVLVEQLRASEVALLEAVTSPLFLEDEDQVRVLEDQVIGLRGEIAALGAELASLNRIALELANTTFADLGDSIADLIRGGGFSQILDGIRALTTGSRALTAVSVAISSGADAIADSVTKIADSVTERANRIAFSFGSIITSIKDFITTSEGLTMILAAVGNAVASAFTSAIQGAESFGDAIKGILGTLLIAIGQAIVALSTGALIVGIFTLDAALVGLAAAGIAIGTGLIIAGSALSGSGQGSASSGSGGPTQGTSTPEFSFSQQSILTQQYFAETAESLRVSSENLDNATENIQGVQPGDVFMKGSEQVGGITRVLARDARRSDRFSSTRDAALAFQGS